MKEPLCVNDKCYACNGAGQLSLKDGAGHYKCFSCFGTGRDLREWGPPTQRQRDMLALLVYLNVPSGVLAPSGIPDHEMSEWADTAKKYLGDEFTERLTWKDGPKDRSAIGLAQWLREHADKVEAGAQQDTDSGK